MKNLVKMSMENRLNLPNRIRNVKIQITFYFMRPYLTLIIPCYNEGEHLEKSFPKVLFVLKKLNKDFEIIIIDDCSNDNTVDIINKLITKNNNSKILFLKHKKNIGRGGTVSEGIKLANGEIVGFIDIDLEISPNYIPQFIEKLNKDNVDVVIGRRIYAFSKNSLIRFLASTLYSLLIHFSLNLPIHDTEVGYKFFNRNSILPVLKTTQDKKWFWDTEIVTRAYMNKLRLAEINVFFKRRKDKTSTVNLFKDTFEYIARLIAFKKSLSK